jgi:thiamine-phosphate pyrophosphorylase
MASPPDRPLRGLYAITPVRPRRDLPLARQVEQAILGGAQLVQYRDKGRGTERRRREARLLREVCGHHGVPLIINDDLTLAVEVRADGVHLGRDDPPPAAARRILGAHALIGVSCYGSLDLAQRAQEEGASYIAFGRFFHSASKPQATVADPAILRLARPLISLPIVAIGGITPENGAPLVAAGAHLLAAIDAIFGRADIRAAAAAFAALFTREVPDAPFP